MTTTEAFTWLKKLWRTNKVLAVLFFIILPVFVIGAFLVKLFIQLSYKTDLREYNTILQTTEEIKVENKKVRDENKIVVEENNGVIKSNEELITKVESNIENRNEIEKELFK